jgi:hypothetical protein
VERANKFGKMAPLMMESFSKIRPMDRENLFIVTEISMKEIG